MSSSFPSKGPQLLYRIYLEPFLDRAASHTNLPVLLVARSVVLDRGQQIGGLFWPICRLGGYIYFRLACYLNLRHQYAGLCVRWAEVSMTCTVVLPAAREF